MEIIEKLRKDVHALLDEGKYTEAKQKILSAIENVDKENDMYDLFVATIAGLFIDLGSEGHDKEAAEAGVKILSEDEDFFKSFLSEQSFNYNMGNGMEALYKIQNHDNELPTLEMVKPNLIQAKNYYFKAYKEIDLVQIGEFDLQILTNLGNSLSQSGRVIEATRLYNSVLNVNRDFPQALIGFAEGLDYWIRISFCPRTISLYEKIYSLLKKGLNAKFMPPKKTTYFEAQLKKYESFLNKYDFDFSSVEKEMQLNDDEYKKHSMFRKYCIDNFLSLNEHSIYCKCSEASIDDLSIVHESLSLYGDKVGKMELLLNRLKSEFNLARKLYYEGLSMNDRYEEVNYSELMDGEIIGEEVEKIRVSFRLCFGIFDKIAHGICYFFDLPQNEDEKIYFESFWKTNRCLERWDKLKDLRNPHLVALYSIANDFNSRGGEFHFYKQWRNKLEHNNLVFVDKTDDPSLFELFENETFVSKVAYPFFKEQGLHLLQICCAAIYSYVYAVRTESLEKTNDKLTTPFIIQPKIKY